MASARSPQQRDAASGGGFVLIHQGAYMRVGLSVLLCCGVPLSLVAACGRAARPGEPGAHRDSIDTLASEFHPLGSERHLGSFCDGPAPTRPGTRVRAGAGDRTASLSIYQNQSSGIATPLRCVARSAAQWDSVLAASRIRRHTALLAVDFNRSMVLVATGGTRSNTGHDIRIETVWARHDTTLVLVHRIAPTGGEEVGELLVTPLHAVAVARSAGPVFFIEQ